jgi:hypothetical protein
MCGSGGPVACVRGDANDSSAYADHHPYVVDDDPSPYALLWSYFTRDP